MDLGLCKFPLHLHDDGPSKHLKGGCSGEIQADVHDGCSENIACGRRKKYERVELWQLWLLRVFIVEVESGTILAGRMSAGPVSLSDPVGDKVGKEAKELAQEHASSLNTRDYNA